MEVRESSIESLDADQRRAVAHRAGPLLLVAGAGSGKTRVIVERTVRLLREGVSPRQIVGITFTNRAADEMRDRVARAVGAGDGRDGIPWLGTFHAYGAGLLRRFADRIGLPRGFAIYDARDQLELIRQVLADAGIDEKKVPPARFASVIERAKREGIAVESAAAALGWPFADQAVPVTKAYGAALASAGAVDFADLIRLPLVLFRHAPDVRDAVRGEIRHLLVDEFQDVDRAQAALTAELAAAAESFCAVGDEDQSIYGWRGGSAGPMLSFERDYPDATVLFLRTNYRCRSSILRAADHVISANRRRRAKEIRAARGEGDPPLVHLYEDADAEAVGVERGIAAEIRRDTSPSRIAVFYRVNAQSRPLEDALRRAGIPYVLRGALSFYDRASVRDAAAYLRWFLNPDDPVSLKRLLKAPRRGVGEAALSRARRASQAEGVPFSRELERIPAVGSLLSFRSRWRLELAGLRPGEALRQLLAGAGYLAWVGDRAQGGRPEDRENVEEFLRLADASPGTGEEALRDFVERVSLAPPENDAQGTWREAVQLMTMHNAKGLEFDVAFLVGLEEGLLPHSRSADSALDVEEERRLFYVALTRARERAHLSLTRRRALFGSFRDAVASRFLSEIPRGLLRWEASVREPGPRGGWGAIAGAGGVGTRRAERPEPARSGAGLSREAGAGMRVRHPVFGEGRVESVEGEGSGRKITAVFPGYGRKRILLRAVKMDIFS